ncbi:MAG TPA: BTAD domain-containing putative transcriptional regulator [Thermoanaerobaculia bacterium]|nr:BTAD domain-containing putative transcriptional regulator [Thermoanaerobaculia bacterium]
MNRAPHALRLLGGFQLSTAEGVPIAIPSKKAQAMIAYLANRGEEGVSRSKIASMIWSDSDPQEARHSLRQCLLMLRKSLPDATALLTIEPDRIAVTRDSLEIDVATFERLVNEGSESAFRSAIDLYRGEFLEGLSLSGEMLDEWLVFERRRLAHLMKKALSALLEITRSEGESDEAIAMATRLLAIDPRQSDVQRALAALYGDPGEVEPDGPDAILVVCADALESARIVGSLTAAASVPARAAIDAVDALLAAGAGGLALAIVDLDLEPLGRVTLAESLLTRCPHLPVLCIGRPLPDQEARFLGLGATDFLMRPIDPEILLLRVERALSGRRPPSRMKG